MHEYDQLSPDHVIKDLYRNAELSDGADDGVRCGGGQHKEVHNRYHE